MTNRIPLRPQLLPRASMRAGGVTRGTVGMLEDDTRQRNIPLFDMMDMRRRSAAGSRPATMGYETAAYGGPDKVGRTQYGALPSADVPSIEPPSGGIMGMMPDVGTPGFAGLSAAAARGLQLSGYQDRPITTGQVLGEMMGAGMQAYQAAQKGQLEERLAEAKIAESEAKSGRIFTGTSFTAQSYQNLIDLGQKIKDGTANRTERQAYGLIYQKLSMPETETRQTDAGVVTVKRPAMDLSAFPTPPGFEPQGERVVGEQSAKFNDGQANAAGFAERMRISIDTFDRLTQAGYDAGNIKDQVSEASGLNALVSPEGQQYNRAKRDFITAVLRRESGAAIAPSEFVTEDKKYFPQPFDDEKVIADKAEARKTALSSMIAQSGPAYKVLFPGPEITLPEGSKLIREIGGKKYYETKGGDILVVDK